MMIMLICCHVGDVERNDITGVRIPLYQISLFVSESYNKCETCVEISEGLKDKCKPIDNNEDGTWGRLQGELESKCAVIKSMEVTQNTMIVLAKDKDELIASQKTLDGMHSILDNET